ncbi:unnamed protein product [Toxocara canis]|uniref:dihydrofolate reductase n=1 Tax=Toxocara canis TaxID=6265 RepID=A0A3P7ES83_TOXCA|nr:unnamed protein product [Toxocara canis]
MATPKLPMKIIVAMDTSLGIGKNGEVPWYLAGDLCRFRRLTTTTEDPAKQNAVLMGRRVWESIPEGKRPLNKRLNVVLSTTVSALNFDGSYLVARSFQGALDMLNGMSDKIETIWNIGGYRVYEEGLKSPQLYQVGLNSPVIFTSSVSSERAKQLKAPRFCNWWSARRESEQLRGLDGKFSFSNYRFFTN